MPAPTHREQAAIPTHPVPFTSNDLQPAIDLTELLTEKDIEFATKGVCKLTLGVATGAGGVVVHVCSPHERGPENVAQLRSNGREIPAATEKSWIIDAKALRARKVRIFATTLSADVDATSSLRVELQSLCEIAPRSIS